MNFTTTLSAIGKKVVLIDMDIGMGNIHILLGKTVPTNLKDYLVGEKSIEEVMFEGPNNLAIYFWWFWFSWCDGVVRQNV